MFQHFLYSDWPQFSYLDGALKGQVRKINLLPSRAGSGSKYLLIASQKGFCRKCSANKQHDPCICTACPTKPNLSSHRCFIMELYDFLFGRVGWEFENPPPIGTKDWDKVIDDLVVNTANKVAPNMKRVSVSDGLRGQGVLCFGNCEEILNRKLAKKKYNIYIKDEPPTILSDYFETEDDGICLVEFVLESRS